MRAPNKNLKMIGLAACLAAMLTTGAVAHAGDSTGGGNGTLSRQEQIRRMRDSLGPKKRYGTKLSPDDRTNIDLWCESITRFLGTQRKRAMSLIQDDDREGAVQVLRDALAVAKESVHFDQRPHSPITYRMLQRGPEMANAVEALLIREGDPEGRGMHTMARFLVSYVGFVIETARELDRPLFVPYLFDNKQPMAALEERFLAYASDQLAYVNGNFVHDAIRDGDFRGIPRGEPRVYLTLAGMIAHYVADDLSHTLSAFANSCAIADLEEVSINVADYLLQGDESVYRYDAYAVGSVRDELAQLDRVISKNACGK